MMVEAFAARCENDAERWYWIQRIFVLITRTMRLSERIWLPTEDLTVRELGNTRAELFLERKRIESMLR
jgi:hypothetical protein